MLFVDGENLTLRAQEVAESKGLSLHEGPYWKRDFFVWIPVFPAGEPYGDISVQVRAPRATRAYYYTSVWGSEDTLEEVRARLWDLGFDPQVFKKKKDTRSKGVDIALTKDMLAHGFRGNYEIAVLVAGDGDYVPLVEEVKRAGKPVYVTFFSGYGLSPALRLAADRFIDITQFFEDRWKSNAAVPAPPR